MEFITEENWAKIRLFEPYRCVAREENEADTKEE